MRGMRGMRVCGCGWRGGEEGGLAGGRAKGSKGAPEASSESSCSASSACAGASRMCCSARCVGAGGTPGCAEARGGQPVEFGAYFREIRITLFVILFYYYSCIYLQCCMLCNIIFIFTF